MEPQTDEEYSAYKARASFFGATARTLEEYLDLVFRRGPTISACDSQALKRFVADCDLWGSDLIRFARRVVGEALAVGRAGSLVFWGSVANRPWLSLWRAEEIINWKAERAGQSVALVEVVLRESAEGGSQKTVDGRRKPEDRRRWTEAGGQWAEVGGQKTVDGRRRMAADRSGC